MTGPRIVVVTGGSAGVGHAIALAFARHGDWVVVLARDQARLDATCEELRAAGSTALGIAVDVSDAAQVEAAADRIERELGVISVWVNNVSTTVFAPALEITAEEFLQVTQVAYLGAVHGTLAALRRMRPRDKGCIVQVGSALAYRSIPLQSAYCAAKAAIRAFTDSLRCELIHDGSGVRLTQVHLPAVNTPQSERQRNKMPKQQQPVPPLFSPESIAEAILSAADRAPREMWVAFPTTKAILGQKVIPGLLDRFLARAGWEPQFVDAPNEQRGDILFETLPGDPGAHGPYSDREQGPDLQMRLQRNTLATAMLAIGAITGVAALVRSRRSAGWRRAGAEAPR